MSDYGWIKLRDLRHHPKVKIMAARLGIRRGDVIGAMSSLWHDADKHADGDVIPHLTAEVIDIDVEIPGFAKVMESVGWLEITEDGARMPGYSEHNGETAKKRAEKNKRQSEWRRGRDASETQVRHDDDSLSTQPRLPEKSHSQSKIQNESHEANLAETLKASQPRERITKRDLDNAATTDGFYQRAVSFGDIPDSELNRIGFHAVAVRASSKGKDAGALFVSLVKKRAWTLPSSDGGPSEADYDKARSRLKHLLPRSQLGAVSTAANGFGLPDEKGGTR